ncbi:MAG: YkvA family protein [Halanaerobiales bacterium]
MRILQTVFKLIKYMTDKNVSLGKKLLFLLPVAYFIFPYDLVFDFFPLVGQLDDIAVLVVIWPFLKKFLSEYDPGENREDKGKKKKDEKTVEIGPDDYEVK